MKSIRIFSLFVLVCLVLSACIPRPVTTIQGWSKSASSLSELSYSFPGEWNGSSPLPTGEGEFAKDPNQPVGIIFQIKLSGNPKVLLHFWGTKEINFPGIVTFAPESIEDGLDISIARITGQTKIAQGNGITAQVAFIQRPNDIMEIMWFAPTELWGNYQPAFQRVLESIELWHAITNSAIGLRTMYIHDWPEPQTVAQDTGLWFHSKNELTGMYVFVQNEILDPVKLLGAWNVERLAPFGFSDCSIGNGNGINTMRGQWASKTGECANLNKEKTTYEIAFVPNKGRLFEIITYASSDTWENANTTVFEHLLGMLTDIR